MFRRRKLGINIGRRHITVAEDDQVVVSERADALIDPDKDNHRVLAIGEESLMIGRYAGRLERIAPLQDIEKYSDVIEYMLDYFIEKALQTQLFPFKPYLVAAIPTDLNGQDKASLVNALSHIRTSKLHTITELEASAVGADLKASSAILNIGSCSANIALLSDGILIEPHFVAVGGQVLDNTIRDYVKAQHNVVIGELTSEFAKINLSNLSNGEPQQPDMSVQGRNLQNGMPQLLVLSADEVSTVIAQPLFGLVRSLQNWFHALSSEKQHMLREDGVVLAGGTALLPGIARFLSEHVSVPMRLAPDPAHAAAIGASRIAQTYDWKHHKKL